MNIFNMIRARRERQAEDELNDMMENIRRKAAVSSDNFGKATFGVDDPMYPNAIEVTEVDCSPDTWAKISGREMAQLSRNR